MTVKESPFDRLLRNPNDREAMEELLKIEDECGGNISAGRYGDRPHYFRNLLQYGPKTADRIEEVQDFLRSQVRTDATIVDAEAFLSEHFKTPKPEIQNILEAAIESEDKAVREEKTREAIALAKGGGRKLC
ncbi:MULTISPECIES: hypothetical protein [Spirulina sp. CCY15215]|uniref:hypothetical protein n=1 Tax=Spirulina sp. CCY15215 TaxID=2767591 RepID=UPI00194E696A|nr:hypothetical protein [Spirulina major]